MEKINNPTHYGGKDNPDECIKVIEAWDLDFCLGNAIKYISRAGKKDSELDDLKKAVWYINRKIEKIEIKVGQTITSETSHNKDEFNEVVKVLEYHMGHCINKL